MINWGSSESITTTDSSYYSFLWSYLRISSSLTQTYLHSHCSTYHQVRIVPSKSGSTEWSYSYNLQSCSSDFLSSLSNEIESNWSK